MKSTAGSGSDSGPESRSNRWVLTVCEHGDGEEQPEPFDSRKSFAKRLIPSGDGELSIAAENGGEEAYLEHAERLSKLPSLDPAGTGNADPILKKLCGNLSARSNTSDDKSVRRSPRGAEKGILEGALAQSQGSNGLQLMQLSDEKELHLNVEYSADKCFRRSHVCSPAKSGSKSNCSSPIVQSMSIGKSRSPDKDCLGAVSPGTCDDLKKRSPVEFKTKILSLSWHAEADAESMTLKYNHPSFSEHLRRSSRVIYGSSNSGANVSPRLSSSLSGAQTLDLNMSDEQPPKKIKTSVVSPGLGALDEKQYQRSASLSSNSECIKSNSSFTVIADSSDEPPYKKIKETLGKVDPGMMDRKFPRQSPRTAASPSDNEFDDIKCDIKSAETKSPTKNMILLSSNNKQKKYKCTFFVGDPIPSEEAQTMDKKFSRQSLGTASCPVGEFEKTKCGSLKLENSAEKQSLTITKTSISSEHKRKSRIGSFFVGDPIPSKEAHTMDKKFSRQSPGTASCPSVGKVGKTECCSLELQKSVEKGILTKTKTSVSSENKHKYKIGSFFVGDPVPFEEAHTMDKKFSRQSPGIAGCPAVDKLEKTKCGSVKLQKSDEKRPPTKTKTSVSSENKQKIDSFFVGDPIPASEAQERWHWRYELKRLHSRRSKRPSMMTKDNDDEDLIISNVECHYNQAEVNKCTYSLGDCAYIKGDGGEKHIGRIIEFFKTTEGENYFRVQWFYKVEDTVIKEANFHNRNRLFYSTVMNDNLIDCILSKVNILQISPKIALKSNFVLPSDFYFDTEYCVEYSTFRTMLPDDSVKSCDLSPNNHMMIPAKATATYLKNKPSCGTSEGELALLDLYSGCGGMSTGLCLGAKNSGVDLVTRWALDSSKSACESLKLNHPETYVRNEGAEDFLELLKEWEKLYKRYGTNDVYIRRNSKSMDLQAVSGDANSLSEEDGDSEDEFEVSRVVDICYGDPDKTGKHGLKLKVHWKGYGPSEDTWEPIEGLSNCHERIQDFVQKGLKSKILPLPGDVDVICGGPPCQGISGYNRFRNTDSPLTDERNRQIIVFMDIVQFLKPKFVLMENVVDILRFDNASLGRYALSRLVCMKYQARLGIMAAGCYGLPQFRLRFFLWGAHPSEKLPQFPLPTHDVIVRYWPPVEFERNTVAYDEDQPRDHLEKALVLEDAISDLPEVSNDESREEMSYEKLPQTEFQRYIRSSKHEMSGSRFQGKPEEVPPIYDHRAFVLNEDNYARVCQIPKRKGANFRDLPGVVVGKDNVARRDATIEQILLPSGKPLVPDFAFTFEQGKSKRLDFCLGPFSYILLLSKFLDRYCAHRPYARLWWDETVPTVITSPNYRSQAALHPEQDRILTIREYARLQGFPDYYRFCGTIPERYRQIGNAVAVPVARALGYVLGMAFQKLGGDEPLMTLPPKFSYSNNIGCTEIDIQKPSDNEPLIPLLPTISYTNNNQSTGDYGTRETEYKAITHA